MVIGFGGFWGGKGVFHYEKKVVRSGDGVRKVLFLFLEAVVFYFPPEGGARQVQDPGTQALVVAGLGENPGDMLFFNFLETQQSFTFKGSKFQFLHVRREIL